MQQAADDPLVPVLIRDNFYQSSAFFPMHFALITTKNEAGVTKDWIDSGTWEVELAWKRHAAKVQLQSFYDPKGERIKAFVVLKPGETFEL